MSLPLKDFRVAITESIDIWLEAEAAAFGKDKQTVAREILADWSKKKAHAHKVATKRLIANGLQMELDGVVAEDDGTPRSGRK